MSVAPEHGDGEVDGGAAGDEGGEADDGHGVLGGAHRHGHLGRASGHGHAWRQAMAMQGVRPWPCMATGHGHAWRQAMAMHGVRTPTSTLATLIL